MSLPTQAQLADAAARISTAAQSELNILGFSLNAQQLAAIGEVFIDALCMKAWKEAQAAGAAAAAAITTPEQAEKELEK